MVVYRCAFPCIKNEKLRDIYIDCHCVTASVCVFFDAEKRFDTKDIILQIISKQV